MENLVHALATTSLGTSPSNITLSFTRTAFLQTHSSSSSRNSDFNDSLHTGHEMFLTSSPGGTTTVEARNVASRSAASGALYRMSPNDRPLPLLEVPLSFTQS